MFLEITCILVLLAADTDNGKDTPEAVIRRLEEEAVWIDPKKALGRLRDVESARRLKLERAVPSLIKHIDFAPHSENLLPVPTVAVKYPVLSALAGIGPVAVPDLVHLLGSLEIPEKGADLDHNGLKRSLAVHALVLIYEKGGFGKALAKRRLELEAARAKGKTRTLIEQALKDPALLE